MKRTRILLYAVLFVIAIHMLVTMRNDDIDQTIGHYIKDGALKKSLPGLSKQIVKGTHKDKKTILWYDVYNKGHGLRNKASNVDFEKCAYKQCILLPPHIIKNGSKGPHETPVTADAFIFQGAHLAQLQLPRRTYPNQVFVFAERESWMFYGIDEKFQRNKYANVFNWTMTYRKDSDIPLLYGEIQSLPKKKSSKDKKNYKKIFSEKKLDVVWLVSNCASKSLREDYIAVLKKHINVDVIGECGNQTCPKRDSRECLDGIERKYKFMLSFENTFHKDYVTEKLFDWFNKDIVQVVYGLANYTTVARKGTVVDSARFESPLALAKFLKVLGADKNRYINHLKRKDEFVAVGHDEMQQRAYCKLCQMLHTVAKHRRVYDHVGTWWQLNSTMGINPWVKEGVVKIGELIKKSHISTDLFVQKVKEEYFV